LPALLVALAFVAFPAHAQWDTGGDPKLAVENVDFYSSCDSSMTADQCMWSPMGGGNYTSCTALGPNSVNPQGQTCQAVIDLGGGRKQCIGVSRSASCVCDTQTFVLKGKCTYIR
jgi:hypothetical protein